MDRNLGAMSNEVGNNSTAVGNYYQWGRKDPLGTITMFYYNKVGTRVGYSSRNFGEQANVATSVANPDVFMTNSDGADWWRNNPSTKDWNNPSWVPSQKDKSFYDPCPVGWTVPKYNIWDKVATTKSAINSISNTGWTIFPCGLPYGTSDAAWYPYSKMRYAPSGGLDNDGKAYLSSNAAGGYMIVTKSSIGVSSGFNYGRASAFPVRCIQE